LERKAQIFRLADIGKSLFDIKELSPHCTSKIIPSVRLRFMTIHLFAIRKPFKQTPATTKSAASENLP